MRIRVVIFLAIALLIAACQGPPPTQIVMVVTATPAENIPTQTPFVIVVTATQQVDATVASLTPEATETQMPAQSPFTPIPVLNAYPTNTFSPIQIAEQIFEGGRMFWLEPSRQIWVMVESGSLNGSWFVFDDTFQEGDTEFDPSIVAPDGYIQPIRGFGKVWRENTNLREALGWATSNELGYVSNYEYHPGGSLNSRGLYEAGPGYHVIYSQTNQAIRFNEGLNEGVWTWQFVSTDVTPTAAVTP